MKYPWSTNLNAFGDLTIFYGSDLAMCLSLAKIVEYKFYSKPPDLYSDNLFDTGSEYTLLLVESSLLNKILQQYKKLKFSKKIILIYNSKIKNFEDSVSYINCEPLNSKTQQWFIDFHCKRLNFETMRCPWVKNLDDLKFAYRLDQNGLSYQYVSPERSIWSEIRFNQFTSFKSVWKHFEMWARENSPNDDALWFYVQKIKGQKS